MRIFPNAIFNKENEIWNERWVIQNFQEVAKFFEFFGFPVITEEQRLEKYKSQLESIIPELIKIGLKVDGNGVLDFENLKNVEKCPEINKKQLWTFPNTIFNKKIVSEMSDEWFKIKKTLQNFLSSLDSQ